MSAFDGVRGDFVGFLLLMGLGWISRKTLSSILNGRSGISPEMALRLSKAFNTSPESWLNQQVQYDLWRAKKRSKGIKVKKLYAT
ncbi:MAG: HigA family addiction module antidote protein [Woeseiaceae bacterium]|nr:HigA family addiction module antidote protein [Woeseiaceae bacterium]